MEIVCVLLFVIVQIGYSELSKFNDLVVNIRHAKKKDLANREDYMYRTYSYNEYGDYSWTSFSEDTSSTIEYESTSELSQSTETADDLEPYTYYSLESSADETFNFDVKEDVVTKFLRIVESQHELGENCTAGTDLNLGDGVVDRYAQVFIF